MPLIRILTSLLVLLFIDFSIPIGVASGMPEPQTKSRTHTKKKTSGSTTKKTKGSAAKKSTSKTSKKSSEQSSTPKTSAEAKKRQEATQKEIKLTEEQIKENESKVKSGLTQLGKLEGEIEASKKKINDLNRKMGDLNGQISGLEGNIIANEAQLSRLRDEYLKAVKKMRVSRKNKSELAFVFSSTNFNQALRRMRYLKEFSQWKDQQSAAISGMIGQLQTQKSDLAQARENHARALDAQKVEQKKQEEQYLRQDAIVGDLRRNGDALKRHLSQKQAEANMLKNQISALIAEEQRKAAEEDKKRREAQRADQERVAREEQARKEAETAQLAQAQNKQNDGRRNTKKDKKQADKKNENKNDKSANTKPANYADARKREPRSKQNGTKNAADGFGDMKGNLPLPASGSFKVTSRFGRQSLPDLPDVVYDNPGIDAEVAAGASALSVFGGIVSGVYMLPGYNTVVIVNHGNYYTVYGNIGSPSVKVGDSVIAGQRLGQVANDEDDPTHGSIHFEVWRNREKLNPLDWIRN